MPIFYLVRHAHADYIADEHRDLSLTGQEAARALCARLVDCGINAIYSSPYKRAVQTILPLASALRLPVHLDLALRERMLAAHPVVDFASAVQTSWRRMDVSLPGGESNREAQKRGLCVLRRLAGESDNVVLSTHGTLLALMLNGLDDHYDITFWQQLRMPDAIRLDAHLDHRGELRLINVERLDW